MANLAKAGAASAILVVLVVAAPSLGAALRSDAEPFKYVALGDSFSAGEGVDPYFRDGPDRKTGRQGVIDNRCHRSSRAYSVWVKRAADARTLYATASGGGKPGSFGGTNKYGSDKNVRTTGDVTWASWACAGAVTKNVLPKSLGGVPQSAKDQTYDRQTQLDSADLAGADLVTITIGGNDAGFVEVLEFCAVRNCNTPVFKQGRTQIIDDTKPLLEKVYKAVAKKAPEARIVVLGYPQLFPKTANEQSCKELSVFLGEQDMLRELGTHLNDKIEAAVKSVKEAGTKIEYVPVAGRFAGHEVCGSKGAWVNGADTTPKRSRGFLDDESFHPTLDGQEDGYAAAVNAALKTKTNAPPPTPTPPPSAQTNCSPRSICDGKILIAPDKKQFWIREGRRYYIGNTVISRCIQVRARAGTPLAASAGVIAGFPDAGRSAWCPYPDGALVKGAGQTQVWKVYGNGTRHWVTCMPPGTAFSEVPAGEPDGHELIGQISLCNFEGRIVRRPSGDQFWIRDGRRYYIGNTVISACIQGRAGTGAPQAVTDAMVDQYPDAGRSAWCPYPDGALVKGAGQTQVWKVYGNGTRHWVTCMPPGTAFSEVPAGEPDGHELIGQISLC